MTNGACLGGQRSRDYFCRGGCGPADGETRVWAVPLLVWLSAAAWRRRSAAWALAAAAAAAVFSDYTPLPWPGHPADPARMAASDLYVLAGLAVLGAVGVALARGGAGPGAGRSPIPTGGP